MKTPVWLVLVSTTITSVTGTLIGGILTYQLWLNPNINVGAGLRQEGRTLD